jgi:predicted NBD/HSP70 family sugar kinase
MFVQPRSRRQTRAAILGHLLQAGGVFRPKLADAAQLSEASLSRILVDLKAAGLIEEIKRPAPYPGGPTGLVSLDRSVRLAALQLTNGWLSVAVGGLAGELHYTERFPLPPTLDFDSMTQLFRDALDTLHAWTRRSRVTLSQIGISLPGFGRLSALDNPIMPCDIARIRTLLDQALPGVPAEFTNSVVAHAMFYRCRTQGYPFADAHLFVLVGQGVAGAWIDDPTQADAFPPVELGHMVFGDGGPRCRCGHHGCVEAYTSVSALAKLLGVAEAELLQLGDAWVDAVAMAPRVREELRRRLFRLGLAIGNTLNVRACAGVAVGGWPSFLDDADRGSLLDGVDASLMGGRERARVSLAFVAPSTGKDPGAALAFAACCLVRRGGMPTASAEAA